jgi:hypothetical protein
MPCPPVYFSNYDRREFSATGKIDEDNRPYSFSPQSIHTQHKPARHVNCAGLCRRIKQVFVWPPDLYLTTNFSNLRGSVYFVSAKQMIIIPIFFDESEPQTWGGGPSNNTLGSKPASSNATKVRFFYRPFSY